MDEHVAALKRAKRASASHQRGDIHAKIHRSMRATVL
jgi:hypothetical protein